MLWPNIEESLKIKKVDLMNDGLEVSVQIDIHHYPTNNKSSTSSESPSFLLLPSLSSTTSRRTANRQKRPHRSTMFGLGSPFASNTTNKYLLTAADNNVRNKSSKESARNSDNRHSNIHTRTSIGNNKRFLLGNSSSARTIASTVDRMDSDHYQSNNSSCQNYTSPLVKEMKPISNIHQDLDKHDDEITASTHSSASPKDNNIFFSQGPNKNHDNEISSRPPTNRRRRFDDLRSSLSFAQRKDSDNNSVDFYQVPSNDESFSSMDDTDTIDSWSFECTAGGGGDTLPFGGCNGFHENKESVVERVSILIDKDGVITFQGQQLIDYNEDNRNGNGDDDDDDGDQYDNPIDDEEEKDKRLQNSSKTMKTKNDPRSSPTSSTNVKTATTTSNANDTIPTVSSTFELCSTNFQKNRDNEKKEFHSIRLACLEIAADQYKNINVEVPDIIVAQVNEHRHQLHACRKQFQRNNQSSQDNLLALGEKKNKNSNNSPKNRKLKTIQKRNRIRLRQNDEIHVAPCQCALSLVGMRGKLVDSNVPFGSESLFHNLLGSRKQEEEEQQQQQQRLTNHRGEMKSMSSRDSLKSMKSIKVSKMVRTCSANVESNNADSSKIQKVKSRQQGSNPLSKNFRADSGTFDAVGYHEITLIRNRDSPDYTTSTRNLFANRRNVNNEGMKNRFADFLNWDAITIRCASHDELDLLVEALKGSSKAKVIPFSTNPKEKLKERFRNEINQSRSRLLSDPSHSFNINSKSSSNGLYCHPINETTPKQERKLVDPAFSEDRPLFLKPSLSGDFSEAKEVEDKQVELEAEFTPTIDEKTKQRSDLNFNKKEYCEFCHLTFTLLTRRHHCRQCQRSICGNCSCMLLIKGGDEKRFCNSCSAEILRKQSEALRGRWNKRYLQSDKLPGKVHNACHKLGVGVMGKLPHWRNFLTTNINQRPAVGRITIELLEAIALPSANMLNGKVDPYVRATVTGYDRDMRWTLREWMPEKRYQLCSGYVSSTLCPRWIGRGRKGGILLTLPIISTAGAVLRLEVLDHNLMRNARGKDVILGVVEIPLSDLPNANLRQTGGIKINSSRKKKNLLYDGYCDRWYRLLSNDHAKSGSVILSKPIPSPQSEETGAKKQEKTAGAGLKSLEEIGKKVQGLCIQPIEWIASAIKLDLPSRPEAFYEEHKKRSMIHIRIKLNASVAGDALSHAWFPPVVKYPPVPPFDPQILYTRVLHVSKQFAPYHKIQQYVEKVIKWELEQKECARAYFIFALHLALLPYLVKLCHVYLFIFLQVQWRKMKAERSKKGPNFGNMTRVDSMNSVDMNMESNEASSNLNFHNSPSVTELNRRATENISLSDNSSTEDQSSETENDEVAKLNIAVNWIAKTWLDNKGLEILQHKLGNLGRDLKNLNSVWNGSNPLLTQAAMICVPISFVLHFLVNPRLLWLISTFTWYFAQSPTSILCVRIVFGFWRGCAKSLRRKHLLDAEMLEEI